MFSFASFANPTAVEVILVPSVILAGFRPSQRQGSHEREITDIGAGNNFGNNRTYPLIPFFENMIGDSLLLLHS
jgi:hypothetical protein